MTQQWCDVFENNSRFWKVGNVSNEVAKIEGSRMGHCESCEYERESIGQYYRRRLNV